MIKYITADTLANTVRMGARSRRPKPVFLESEKADLELVQTLLSGVECRVIVTHTRQNAIETFDRLVKSGYQGVFTAVNTRFAPANEPLGFAEGRSEVNKIVGIEGPWEDVKSQTSIPAAQQVRVTFIGTTEKSANGETTRPTNLGMLLVLQELAAARSDMNPKTDGKDYLAEARQGAMYGFGND